MSPVSCFTFAVAWSLCHIHTLWAQDQTGGSTPTDTHMNTHRVQGSRVCLVGHGLELPLKLGELIPELLELLFEQLVLGVPVLQFPLQRFELPRDLSPRPACLSQVGTGRGEGRSGVPGSCSSSLPRGPPSIP